MKIISNAEAFALSREDKNIPLMFDGYDFKFTRQWFRNRNQITWSTYLLPMLDASKVIHALQIGVFEFNDAAWLMQNLLTHPSSTLIGIDPWSATTKFDQKYMNECYERSLKNSRFWGSRVLLIRGYSQNVLPGFVGGFYDLIIIDGDHNAPAVLSDAKNALRLLKSGGVMVFDDVRNRIPKKDHVLKGIELFLEEHNNDVQLAWQHRYADAYVKL